jgi:hypothetical protein
MYQNRVILSSCVGTASLTSEGDSLVDRLEYISGELVAGRRRSKRLASISEASASITETARFLWRVT